LLKQLSIQISGNTKEATASQNNRVTMKFCHPHCHPGSAFVLSYSIKFLYLLFTYGPVRKPQKLVVWGFCSLNKNSGGSGWALDNWF
jgi:hypothetical protein